MSTVIDARSWTSEYQDLVDAANAGKTLQCVYDDGTWYDCSSVGFSHPRSDYRVKPCKPPETYWGKPVPPGWDVPLIERTYDPINPAHYKGDIECIDYQKSISTPEEFRGYLRLQAVKYIHRLNAKDTPTTNIDKALWYLNRLKKELET